MQFSRITAVGATVFAFFGSCCALPLLLLGLGVGSAGFASTLVPLRPYLIGATLFLLVVAFYTVYGCKETCSGNGACGVKKIRHTKILLWVATGLALLFLLGPDLIARWFL